MVSYELVRELFDYRSDGCLIWKVSKARRIAIGDIAGSVNTCGYHQVTIDKKTYKAHRLIWLWHHGYMPEGDLDHINRIKSDDRIENLREASKQCNARNSKNRINNTSGVKGVSPHKCRSGMWKWKAGITVMYKSWYLGVYSSFDEAVLARLNAEQFLGWESCDSYSPAHQYALENCLI